MSKNSKPYAKHLKEKLKTGGSGDSETGKHRETSKISLKKLSLLNTDDDEEEDEGTERNYNAITPYPSASQNLLHSPQSSFVVEYAKSSNAFSKHARAGNTVPTPSSHVFSQSGKASTTFSAFKDDTDGEDGESYQPRSPQHAEGSPKSPHSRGGSRRGPRRLSASKSIRAGDIEKLTSSGVLPQLPKDFTDSSTSASRLEKKETNSISSKHLKIVNQISAQRLAQDYLHALRGNRSKPAGMGQHGRRGSASQQMLDMKYGEGGNMEDIHMPSYAENLDVNKRRRSSASSGRSSGEEKQRQFADASGIARSLLQQYTGSFADETEAQNRKEEMLSELENLDAMEDSEGNKMENATLDKLKRDMEAKRRRKTNVTTALAGSRILYGSLIALEAPTGGFLCVRKPPKQLQMRTEDYPDERRTSIGSNTTTKNEYRLSEVESFVTVDAPRPAKKVPNQYTTFRVTNADWPGDEGRIKEGDRVCLQVANNWVLGSKLTAGRTESAETYTSRIDKLLKSIEEYRTKVTNSIPSRDPPSVTEVVAKLEKEIFESENLTEDESDEVTNFLRSLSDPSKWPTLTDDIEGSMTVLQAVDELQAAINLHYAEDEEEAAGVEGSNLKRKLLEEYHNIKAKRNNNQVCNPSDGTSATWRPAAIPTQPATQQTRQYLYNWTLRIHASAKAGTAEAAADDEDQKQEGGEQQSSDHWLDSMIGSQDLLANGSFISLNQDFGHLVVTDLRGLDAQVKTEPSASTLRERDLAEQQQAKQEKQKQRSELKQLKSMFREGAESGSHSPRSSSDDDDEAGYRRKVTDGFASDAVAVCDLPENLRSSSGVGVQGIVNGKQVAGKRQMLSERVAKVFGLEQQQFFSDLLSGKKQRTSQNQTEDAGGHGKSTERLGLLSRRVRIADDSSTKQNKWLNRKLRKQKHKNSQQSADMSSGKSRNSSIDQSVAHSSMFRSLSLNMTGRENMFSQPRVSSAGMWRVHLCSTASGHATLQKNAASKVTTAKTGSSDDGTSAQEGTARTPEQESEGEGMASQLERRGVTTMIHSSWASFSTTAAFAMLMNIASTQLGAMQQQEWLKKCGKLVNEYPRFRRELSKREPELLEEIQKRNSNVVDRVERSYNENVVNSPSKKSALSTFDFEQQKKTGPSASKVKKKSLAGQFAHALDPQNNLTEYQRNILESETESRVMSLKATVSPHVWSRMNKREVYIELSRLSGGSKLEAAVVALQRAFRDRLQHKWDRLFHKYDVEVDRQIKEDERKEKARAQEQEAKSSNRDHPDIYRYFRGWDGERSEGAAFSEKGSTHRTARSTLDGETARQKGRERSHRQKQSEAYSDALKSATYIPTDLQGVVVRKKPERKTYGYDTSEESAMQSGEPLPPENVATKDQPYVRQTEHAEEGRQTKHAEEGRRSRRRSSVQEHMEKLQQSLEYAEATRSRRASMESQPGDILDAMRKTEEKRQEERDREGSRKQTSEQKQLAPLEIQGGNFSQVDTHSATSPSSQSTESSPEKLYTPPRTAEKPEAGGGARSNTAPVAFQRTDTSRSKQLGNDYWNETVEERTKARRNAAFTEAKREGVEPTETVENVKPKTGNGPDTPVQKLLGNIQGTYFEALHMYEERAKERDSEDEEAEENPSFVSLKRSLSSLSSFDEADQERSLSKKNYRQRRTLKKGASANSKSVTKLPPVNLEQVPDNELRTSLAFLSHAHPQLFRDKSSGKMLKSLYK
eukprot:gb/GECG01011958.1/.p1 GENE.gb/GECG01011958.1/~~gb/GECG01011958.1/.p1  ORF type:complete len:1722 (+),score=315.90 gb/GECG01011958.1/:1-5166(+)